MFCSLAAFRDRLCRRFSVPDFSPLLRHKVLRVGKWGCRRHQTSRKKNTPYQVLRTRCKSPCNASFVSSNRESAWRLHIRNKDCLEFACNKSNISYVLSPARSIRRLELISWLRQSGYQVCMQTCMSSVRLSADLTNIYELVLNVFLMALSVQKMTQ